MFNNSYVEGNTETEDELESKRRQKKEGRLLCLAEWNQCLDKSVVFDDDDDEDVRQLSWDFSENWF